MYDVHLHKFVLFFFVLCFLSPLPLLLCIVVKLTSDTGQHYCHGAGGRFAFWAVVHAVIESLRLEKTCKLVRSILRLTLLSPPLNHFPKPHMHTSLKYLQGRHDVDFWKIQNKWAGPWQEEKQPLGRVWGVWSLLGMWEVGTESTQKGGRACDRFALPGNLFTVRLADFLPMIPDSWASCYWAVPVTTKFKIYTPWSSIPSQVPAIL